MKISAEFEKYKHPDWDGWTMIEFLELFSISAIATIFIVPWNFVSQGMAIVVLILQALIIADWFV